MDKAEQQARKVYPYENGVKGLICEQSIQIYVQGYHQAEKDILKDARWIEIYEDTTWKMVEDFIHQNMDGAYRIIIVKD